MSAKYVKIKNKFLKEDQIDSKTIKNRSITSEDIAIGTITGEIFKDYSIPAIKLSDEITKLGNIFNAPNRLLKLNENGKIPNNLIDFESLTFEQLATYNLSDVEGEVNSPNGLLKLDDLGAININTAKLSNLYLSKTQTPQILNDKICIYFNESDNKLHIKTETEDKVLVLEIHFISDEEPQGEINGENTVFVLQHPPILNSERVFINGLRERKNNYQINGNELIFNEPPFVGAVITIDYSYIIIN